MKFIHISDLHIGKRLNDYSLIEDQEYILGEILKIIEENNPDCVFLAGDVYDKSVPSAEAVGMLDAFLEKLAALNTKTFIISGNHDSSERLSYARGVFEKQNIFIAPTFDGSITKHEVCDEYGKVSIYLLPFLRPANVRRYFENVESYTDAINCVIKNANIDGNERNVILAHQFVIGSERRESEEEAIGGLDGVESWVFDEFDYVALGHIHTMQKAGKTGMYSGTPLKYSASEAGDEKGIILGEIKEKGEVEIVKIPLDLLRDYVVLTGKLDDVLKGENKTDYVKIILTDEESVVDAYGKLKINYPYMTELSFERGRRYGDENVNVKIEKSVEEQFSDFYTMINGQDLTDEQTALIKEIIGRIKEAR